MLRMKNPSVTHSAESEGVRCQADTLQKYAFGPLKNHMPMLWLHTAMLICCCTVDTFALFSILT